MMVVEVKRRGMLNSKIVIGLIFSLFQIWSGFSGGLPELAQRAIHLGFGLSLGLLLYPMISRPLDTERKIHKMIFLLVGGLSITLLMAILLETSRAYLHVEISSFSFFTWVIVGLFLTLVLYVSLKVMGQNSVVAIVNGVLGILVVSVSVYAIANYERIMFSIPTGTALDRLAGLALLFLVFEVGRRAVGWTLPILLGIMVLYTLFGHYIPGFFGHRTIPVNQMLEGLFVTPATSVYGVIIGTSAVLVAVLIIYGDILTSAGCGEQFINMALLIVGKSKGGPPKVAVIASSLFGMITGSAVANAAVVGNFTIPLMKRSGYSPAYAAGLEATASTGGQIMPPILGVAAFVMAQLLSVKYVTIVFAAILPAIAFYGSCFLMVDLEARRAGVAPLRAEQIPTFRAVLSRWPTYTTLGISVAALLVMVIVGYPIAYAVFWALVCVVVLYLLIGGAPRQFWQRMINLFRSLEQGLPTLVSVVIIMSLAQTVVSLLGISGLGAKVGVLISSIGGGSTFVAFLVAALIALVLGMGMPTISAYLVGVGVVVPGLINMGVLPLVAHMFVFYYSIMASVTPPLCAAVFVTAPIASCDWPSAAKHAVRFSFAGLLIPFVFAYHNGLLLIGKPIDILWAIVLVAGTIFAWSSAISGFMSRRLRTVERVALFAGGALVVVPGFSSSMVGLGIILTTYVWQRFINHGKSVVHETLGKI